MKQKNADFFKIFRQNEGTTKSVSVGVTGHEFRGETFRLSLVASD